MIHQIELLEEQKKDLIYLNSILERNNRLQKEEITYLKRCLGIDLTSNDKGNFLTIE